MLVMFNDLAVYLFNCNAHHTLLQEVSINKPRKIALNQELLIRIFKQFCYLTNGAQIFTIFHFCSHHVLVSEVQLTKFWFNARIKANIFSWLSFYKRPTFTAAMNNSHSHCIVQYLVYTWALQFDIPKSENKNRKQAAPCRYDVSNHAGSSFNIVHENVQGKLLLFCEIF